MTRGKFPALHKSASVCPRLNKPHLDTNDLSTYKPISNSSFVSKILEPIIDSRFTEHADLCNLLSPHQTAYRKFHSNETVLVKVHNDIITAIDRGDIGALAMLYLTSAFDTVDRQILLDVLHQHFAVNDLALDWFRSYLSNRSYTVHLNSDVSETVVVYCGEAQGSSLGPKTFIAYTEEMDGVFAQHDVSHHCFADDTQAYTHASRSQASAVANQLNTCIADVADWCGSHRLQLNTDKTNLCGSVRRRHCSPYRHLIEVLLSARIQSKRVIVRVTLACSSTAR